MHRHPWPSLDLVALHYLEQKLVMSVFTENVCFEITLKILPKTLNQQ